MSDILYQNSAFFLSLSTMAFAFLTLSIRYAYNSKCSDIRCCGCHIKRNVELEEKETEFRIENQAEQKDNQV